MKSERLLSIFCFFWCHPKMEARLLGLSGHLFSLQANTSKKRSEGTSFKGDEFIWVANCQVPFSLTSSFSYILSESWMKQMQRASLPRVQRKICETNCRSNGILVRTVARILWYHENLDAMYAFKSLRRSKRGLYRRGISGRLTSALQHRGWFDIHTEYSGRMLKLPGRFYNFTCVNSCRVWG